MKMKNVVGVTVALMVGICGNAMAGSYKVLKTRTLAAGASVYTYVTPTNSDIGGQSMSMDFYAWTTPGSATSPTAYMRCNILSNTTGRTLCIRPIGLTGQLLNTGCCAVNGSSCAGPTMSLVGGEEFVCAVASGYGSPVNGGYYRMSVERLVPPAVASASSFDAAPAKVNPSGSVTSGQ